MPTNLPPECFAAEKKYKEATSPQDKATALEALIATIPKHKGTDKLRAEYRKKLSRLREDAVKKKKSSGRGDLYSVPREGAAQAALIGFTNCGKSSLLAALTNAHPAIAEYPMTTSMPLSGMMPYEDIQFQLVDLPGIGIEASDGWVSGILRNADILILVLDLSDAPETQAELLFEQLTAWGFMQPKQEREGGHSNPREKNPALKKTIVAANKSDLPGADQAMQALEEISKNVCPLVAISCQTRQGLEQLRGAVFELSQTVRVYSKQPGREPDMLVPFTVATGTTVLELSETIHKEFKNLKYACVWGSSRFPGQKVQKDHVLVDKDIVELHI